MTDIEAQIAIQLRDAQVINGVEVDGHNGFCSIVNHINKIVLDILENLPSTEDGDHEGVIKAAISCCTQKILESQSVFGAHNLGVIDPNEIWDRCALCHKLMIIDVDDFHATVFPQSGTTRDICIQCVESNRYIEEIPSGELANYKYTG